MTGFKIKVDEKEILNFIDAKLDEVADFIFASSQQNIVDKQIIDEGTLLKTANVNRSYLEKTIVYPVPYADEIEFGRLPGNMPPVESIKNWIRRKGIAKNEKEVNSIAWAISQDIKKNGKEPRPFLGPAIEQAKIRFRR